ncbi:MAG TPA: DUF3794 domain-containing protein [Firmicutes bacterium]|jgi:hypothetical protein|nr:DUF3794 domain-containing protein [Bacillota bacterium]
MLIVTDNSMAYSECIPVQKQKINALKVIGEGTGQAVIENSTCINAIKIDRIKAKLLNSTDHLFRNKVIKKGIIRKEIFYVDPKNRLRHLEEDVPFTLILKTPGLEPTPRTKIHNELVHIDVDYALTPTNKCIPGCLRQIINVQIQIKIVKWTQIEVITNAGYYPTVRTSRVIKANLHSNCC